METGSWCLVSTFLWNFYYNYFFVCVYLWCVHVIDAHYCVCLDYRFTFLGLAGSQTHTTVFGLETHIAVSFWITHAHYCVQLDYRYTLLCLAGLQIHTIVPGFIRAWGSKLNFSCLWTKCFTHRTSPFLIHRVITHRTICLCHLVQEYWRGRLEISKWSALPNFLVWLQHAYSHEKTSENTASQSMDEASTSGKTMAVVGAEQASALRHNGVHIFKGGNKSLS